MKNNGKTYIWLPSSLTVSKLTVETAAIVNAVHTAVGLPAGFSAGDTNPHYLDLNDLDMGGAPFTRDAEPGMAVCGPIVNLGYLPLDYVALIVAFGGDIESLPVWFEVDDIDTDCPFSTATPKEKWATWGTFGESHKPVQLGGKWYRSCAVGQSGELLSASDWVPLRSLGQLTVLSKSDFLEVVAANSVSM